MSGNRLAGDLDHVLEATRELWEDLRRERIFITGGTGFFGCWLLESFAWANARLGLNASALVLTRNVENFRIKAPALAADPAIKFHIGDVRSFEYPVGGFSHIIHAATDSSGDIYTVNPLGGFDTIVEGTRHTLEFARKCDARKFLLTSSGAVYGKQPPEIAHVPEEYPGAPDPADPGSAYGEGKRSAETLCSLYSRQYGIQTKVARCFAFLGPYLPLNAHFAVGNFMRDGLNGGPIVVKGDGTPHRSYLYAADLAIWLWTILFRGDSCRAYNVGSESVCDIATLAQVVKDIVCPGGSIIISQEPQPGHPSERYVPSTLRARQELGLQDQVGLEDGIRRMVQWNLERQR